MVLGKLLSGGTIKAVAGVIDDLHTSDEEKLQLKKIRGMEDGGLAQAIEKVKAKGMEGGGKAVPPKFKGFSKLPESVQQQMNPDLAEKFGMGGDVKGKKGKNICRGRGIARKGTGFTLR